MEGVSAPSCILGEEGTTTVSDFTIPPERVIVLRRDQTFILRIIERLRANGYEAWLVT
jgi:hypothetical protein